VQAGVQLNENMMNYNVGVGLQYKLPKFNKKAYDPEKSVTPRLEFRAQGDANRLTPSSLKELNYFAQELAEAPEAYESVLVQFKTNRSTDAVSQEANRLTLERVAQVRDVLLHNEVPKRKIILQKRPVTIRKKIAVRVQWE
jgi:hypothetical protein